MVRRDGYELAYVEYLGNNIEVERREHMLPADTLLVRDGNRFYVFVPKKAEWMGDGLPPIGTACEYRIKPSDQWHPCEIRYQLNDPCEDMHRMVVWCPELNWEQVSDSSWDFRAPRTHDQIVAEEMDAAVKRMKSELLAKPENLTGLDGMCAALYRIGYRKQADK